jgi:DNA polymerase III delta prime subunit
MAHCYMHDTGAMFKSPNKGPSSSKGERIDRRPESKVLLLCGPPGMGKTTLAHIVARQAGYRPMEINASDDRTAAVLQDKVSNTCAIIAVYLLLTSVFAQISLA